MSFQEADQELQRYRDELFQAELKLLQAQTKTGLLNKRGLELETKLEKAVEEEKAVAREIQARNDKIQTLGSSIRSKKQYIK